jgi:NADPH-dependent curcumin reductase CurA
MEPSARAVCLVRYVEGGALSTDAFAVQDVPVRPLADGEVRLQALAISVDPYLRGRMTGKDTFFLPQFPLGEPLMSSGVARVTESRHLGYAPGDVVSGHLQWADTAVWPSGEHDPRLGGLAKVDLALAKASHWVGALGLNGRTAFFGVLGVARPRPGQTVLVSGAAGGIGSLAGQIARIQGAHVVGLAGGPGKCAVLTEQLGFDGALDYRSPTFDDDLRAALPDGPDIYFDNVGGELSQKVMWSMSRGALVVECGQISTYDDEGGGWTVDIRPIHANGLRWQSFTTAQFAEYEPAAVAQLGHWLRTGRIVALETERHGLDALPAAMVGLLRGENTGKMVVTL